MGKVKNLSITEKVTSFFKRFTALALTIFTISTPLHGTAENSEVEITSSTKVEDQIEDNQNDISMVEQLSSVDDFIERVEKTIENTGNLHIGGIEEEETPYMWFSFNPEHCMLIADELANEGIIEKNTFIKDGGFIACNEYAFVMHLAVLKKALEKDESFLKCWFYSEEEFQEFNEYWSLVKEFLNEFKKNPKKADKDLLRKFIEITSKKYNIEDISNNYKSISNKTKIILVSQFLASEINNSFEKDKKFQSLIEKIYEVLKNFENNGDVWTDLTFVLPDGTLLDANSDDTTTFLATICYIYGGRFNTNCMEQANLDEQYNELIKAYKEAMIIRASDEVIEEHESSIK